MRLNGVVVENPSNSLPGPSSPVPAQLPLPRRFSPSRYVFLGRNKTHLPTPGPPSLSLNRSKVGRTGTTPKTHCTGLGGKCRLIEPHRLPLVPGSGCTTSFRRERERHSGRFEVWLSDTRTSWVLSRDVRYSVVHHEESITRYRPSRLLLNPLPLPTKNL